VWAACDDQCELQSVNSLPLTTTTTSDSTNEALPAPAAHDVNTASPSLPS